MPIFRFAKLPISPTPLSLLSSLAPSGRPQFANPGNGGRDRASVAARSSGADRSVARPCRCRWLPPRRDCRRVSKRVSAPENENAEDQIPTIQRSRPQSHRGLVKRSRLFSNLADANAPAGLEQHEDPCGKYDREDGSSQDDVHEEGALKLDRIAAGFIEDMTLQQTTRRRMDCLSHPTLET